MLHTIPSHRCRHVCRVQLFWAIKNICLHLIYFFQHWDRWHPYLAFILKDKRHLSWRVNTMPILIPGNAWSSVNQNPTSWITGIYSSYLVVFTHLHIRYWKSRLEWRNCNTEMGWAKHFIVHTYLIAATNKLILIISICTLAIKPIAYIWLFLIFMYIRYWGRIQDISQIPWAALRRHAKTTIGIYLGTITHQIYIASHHGGNHIPHCV